MLEVVVAMALSVVLLAALLTALDLQRRLWSAGRADVERAQLERAILEKIAKDIRAVSFRLPVEEEPSQPQAASDSSEETADVEPTPEELVVTADEALANPAAALAGDSSNLVLRIDRPSRQSPLLLAAAASGDAELYAAATVRDNRSVAYFLAQSGVGDLQVAAASYLTTLEGSPAVGLVRLEGNAQTLQYADSLGDVDTLAAHAQLLAPEAAHLQFRYFDGLTWYDAWDSAALGTLPTAVEITLGVTLATDSDRIADATISVDIDAVSLKQLVVFLPTSQPVTATDAEAAY